MRWAWLCLALVLATQAQAHEAQLQGLIVNGTLTRSGQEFYRKFCERLTDTSALDFNLAVKERPSARWGALVWVEQDNRSIYRRFIQPNVPDIEQTAYEAADQVVQEINRKKVAAIFEDTIDLAKDEL